jgi:hypothetical protein
MSAQKVSFALSPDYAVATCCILKKIVKIAPDEINIPICKIIHGLTFNIDAQVFRVIRLILRALSKNKENLNH